MIQISEIDQKVARHYGVHPAFITAVRRGEWGAVKFYAQTRWNEDGYRLLKKNENAVNRIVAAFAELIQDENYTIDDQTRKQIAFYIHHLGVAALIDDLKAAFEVNRKIKTINYFMKSGDGKASRWGNLYTARQAAIYEREKAEHTADLEALNQVVNLKPAGMTKPDWVIKAEARRQELLGIDRSLAEAFELQKIERNLNRYMRGELK